MSRTKGISEDDVLDAVAGLIETHGYSPSFREVASALDVNLSTVARWLSKLRSKGRIAYEDESPRTLRIVG